MLICPFVRGVKQKSALKTVLVLVVIFLLFSTTTVIIEVNYKISTNISLKTVMMFD